MPDATFLKISGAELEFIKNKFGSLFLKNV